MAKKSLYRRRANINYWEFVGICQYLKEAFNLESFIFNDNTISFDTDKGYFGAYKLDAGDYLYITLFIDEGDDINYTLNLSDNTFYQVDDELNVIGDELTDIF